MKFVCLLSLFVFAGCSSLLPKHDLAPVQKWETYISSQGDHQEILQYDNYELVKQYTSKASYNSIKKAHSYNIQDLMKRFENSPEELRIELESLDSIIVLNGSVEERREKSYTNKKSNIFGSSSRTLNWWEYNVYSKDKRVTFQFMLFNQDDFNKYKAKENFKDLICYYKKTDSDELKDVLQFERCHFLKEK